MAIRLDSASEARLKGSIQRFFREELDEEIGDLKAARVLEFVLREFAPSVYNQAMADARAYLETQLAEMGDVRYEPEFDFWKRR